MDTSTSPTEPAQQIKLRSALESKFSGKLTPLTSLRWQEFGLTVGLKREDMREAFATLRDAKEFLFNMLIDVTAVDWMDRREPRFDVVYQLLSITYNTRLCLKVQAEEESCAVESVRHLWPSANFLEREVWDMYGIDFKGHGDLRRILMYDEFVGHPLRKDYPIRGKQPRVPLRLPELRNDSEDMIREELVSLPVPGRSRSEGV